MTETEKDRKFVSLSDLSNELFVSTSTTKKYLSDGNHPIRKIGRKSYISLSTLDKFLTPRNFCSYAAGQIWDALRVRAIEIGPG